MESKDMDPVFCNKCGNIFNWLITHECPLCKHKEGGE